MTTTYINAEIVNCDGVPVHLGNGPQGGDCHIPADNIYYCGRWMYQCRCGSCDGQCGPSNGCPCNSCKKLLLSQTKFSLPTMTTLERQLEKSIISMRNILENSKSPIIIESSNHLYEDKYLLTEYLTKSSIASTLNCLINLGLTSQQILTICTWIQSNTITLSFHSTEQCSLIKSMTHEIVTSKKKKRNSIIKTVKKFLNISSSSHIISTITLYYWQFEVSYEILIFKGVKSDNVDNYITIQKRYVSGDIVTTSDVPPYPNVHIVPPNEIDITWLFLHINKSLNPSFTIDRKLHSCRTPRRNTNVTNSERLHNNIIKWCDDVYQYFYNRLYMNILSKNNDKYLYDIDYENSNHQNSSSSRRIDLTWVNTESLLIPTVPVFISELPIGENEETALVHGASDEINTNNLCDVSETKQNGLENYDRYLEMFLSEQRRLLQEKCQRVQNSILSHQHNDINSTAGSSENTSMLSSHECILLITLLHIKESCQTYVNSINYIEELLYRQLRQAIGRELDANDFTEYMDYHISKIIKRRYCPLPFCYNVRRSVANSTEGNVSIESKYNNNNLDVSSISSPICTMVNHISQSARMSFALNAATRITLCGDTYIHGYVQHDFMSSQENLSTLQLVAESRQFSSFILLIGRIVSKTEFDPKYAILMKNKDSLSIPLNIEQIPSAKEFKSAIKSLSPEQQQFAQAIRQMQLESTLFGICVIQIKPLLEKVLNLPSHSLTKEIELNESLMELFIEYQIPSDMMSYSGPSDAEVSMKIDSVKDNVLAMQVMLDDCKQSELISMRQEAKLAMLDQMTLAKSGFLIDDVSDSDCASGSLEYEGGMRYGYEDDCDYECDNDCDDGMFLKASGLLDSTEENIQPVMTNSIVKMKKGKSNSNSKEQKKTESVIPELANNNNNNNNNKPGGDKNSNNDGCDIANNVTENIADNVSQELSANDIEKTHVNNDTSVVVEEKDVDYTKLPSILDARYEQLGTVRSTIIHPANEWRRLRQKSLLKKPESEILNEDNQKEEKNKAFDLLDALTKSGAIPIENASVHVVIIAAHCFDKSLIDTIIQKNINPIEKVEQSVLIMASTVHDIANVDLLK